MTTHRDISGRLRHPLGVAGLAGVRGFRGSGAPRIRHAALIAVLAFATLCLSSVPASAALEHKFETAITGISAEGTGTLTEATTTITQAQPSAGSGPFILGEEISGEILGKDVIPPGTTIEKVEGETLTLSQAVEAGGSGLLVPLKAHQPFVNPWGLAFGAEGNLFLADPGVEGSGPSSLDVFGSASESIGQAPLGEFAADGFTRSVAVSAATGDVYVAVNTSNHILVFKPKVPGNPAAGYEKIEEWTGEENEKEKEKHKGPGFGHGFDYVAVDNSSDAHAGDVVVLATETHELEIIKPGPSGEEGETVKEISLDGVDSNDGLAVGPLTGDVYVALPGKGEVAVFNAAGEPQPERQPRGFETPTKSFTPTAVTVDPSTGEVYVVDQAAHVVDEFSPAGRYETQIIGAEPPTPLTEPLGVAVSSTGQVYVSDGTAKAVDVYAPEPATPPRVEDESVTNVTDNSAILHADVSPRTVSGEPATTYSFRYGICATPTTCKESEYGPPTPAGSLGPGFEPDPVSTEVQGLTATRTYHFRVTAENAHGSVEGPERVFTTRGTGEFVLPDGREWEMVSPPQKEGTLIRPLNLYGDTGNGGAVQAAADGGALTYLTASPTESAPPGYSNSVQVFSARGSGGWSSRDISYPNLVETGLSLGEGEQYQLFSPDLSRGALQPFGSFVACESAEGVAQPCLSGEASEQTAFLRYDYRGGAASGEQCASSCYRPFVTGREGYANVPPRTVFGGTEPGGVCPVLICGPRFVGASPDLRHVVLDSGAALTSTPASNSLYEWSDGKPPSEQLALVSLLPLNEKGEELPASGAHVVRDGVSADGSRVFFSAQGHLYVRDTVRGRTVQLDVPEPGCPEEDHCGEGEVEADFQFATPGGDRVLFSDTQKLTADGGAYGRRDEISSAADLYECRLTSELDCALRDLTPKGEQLGVLGTSEDGSWVYFVANAKLAGHAVPGTCRGLASAHTVCDLYVSHDGETRLVAVLSGEDIPDWQGPTARVSPSGQWLAFMSLRSLTGYDNSDAVSGKPDEEVYLYDGAAGQLACASCDPTGARPHGVEYGSSGEGRLFQNGGDWADVSLAGEVPSRTNEGGGAASRVICRTAGACS